MMVVVLSWLQHYTDKVRRSTSISPVLCSHFGGKQYKLTINIKVADKVTYVRGDRADLRPRIANLTHREEPATPPTKTSTALMWLYGPSNLTMARASSISRRTRGGLWICRWWRLLIGTLTSRATSLVRQRRRRCSPHPLEPASISRDRNEEAPSLVNCFRCSRNRDNSSEPPNNNNVVRADTQHRRAQAAEVADPRAPAHEHQTGRRPLTTTICFSLRPIGWRRRT